MKNLTDRQKSKSKPLATPKPCRPDGYAVYVGTERQREGAPPLRDDCVDVTLAWIDRVPAQSPRKDDHGFLVERRKR